jgi:hypothetical protein
MHLSRSIPLLVGSLLVVASAACSSGDSGATSTGGAASSTSATSATSTGEGGSTPGEKCSYSDPPAGKGTIRLSLIGVAAFKGKKAAWRVREKGGTASILSGSELLGGGPYCPTWVAADVTKSYEIDVVLDLNGNGTCEAPPADAVLTGAVPAFVNGLAELDLVYNGTSSGMCGDFMLP